MKNAILHILIIFGVTFLIGMHAQVLAASFDFDPDSTEIDVDDTFTVTVDIDAGTDQIAGTDIYISYDDDLLDLQSVTGASYFPLVSNIPSTDRLYISGVVANQGEYKTGAGTVATLIFKGVADGSTELTFDCDLTQTDTSKIVKNDINASNVINCSALETHAVTIGAGDDTSANDSPDALPASGVYDMVVQYSMYGGALLLLGIILKLLLHI